MLLARLPAPLKPAAMLLVQRALILKMPNNPHVSVSPNKALHQKTPPPLRYGSFPAELGR